MFQDLASLKSKPLFSIVSYAMLVCILYQFGYWSKFDIDILQYFSIQDIPRVTVYPLVSSLLYFSIALFFYPTTRSKAEATLLKDEEGIIILKGPTSVLFWATAIIAFVLCAAVYRWFVYGRWLSMAVIMTPLLSSTIRRTYLLKHISIKIQNEPFLAYAFILLPIMAFAFGKTDAESTINRISYSEIRFDNETTSHIYLGKAGDYILQLGEDNSTIIFQDITQTKQFTIAKTKPRWLQQILVK